MLPLHPRTSRNVRGFGLDRTLRSLIVLTPLGYLDFLSLVAGSRLVITDSGGIQEETTYLRVPCLTLRDTTERPITVECGTNRLVGTERKAVLSGFRAIIDSPPAPGDRPPLWDGRAGERIANVLVERL